MTAASVAAVDVAALAHNIEQVRSLAAPAMLCAVVKADGYGHGAVRVARKAVDSGVEWLAVAQLDEAVELRSAGIEVRILVLSEIPSDDRSLDRALATGLHLTVYRREFIDALEARAGATGVPRVPLHLKVDTGMRRVGCAPDDALALARRIHESGQLSLAGTMTHLAVADEPGLETTAVQLEVFDAVLASLREAGIDPGITHAANSAGAIAHPTSRYDLVRVGIALYGIPPAPSLASTVDLRPALRWTSAVRHLKEVEAGDAVSYGHRHTFTADTTVATVPVGYADGLRRRLGLMGGEVLVGGRRCPIVGVVTMDQFVVDVGTVDSVSVGDEVVLIGAQGDEEITADEMAARLDTIGYEVVCAIGNRVERVSSEGSLL